MKKRTLINWLGLLGIVSLLSYTVVALSIASLTCMVIGGFRKKSHVLLATWATVALAVMCVGAVGTNAAPQELFGVFERFSVFAATGFNAVLGVYLFADKFGLPT
jgi:hypothetical protein